MFFEEAFNFVMRQEGGYVNDPHDRGGATKYGISSAFIKANNIKIEDVNELTVDQAKSIYNMYFWNPLKVDQFTDSIVQLFLFDTAVNCGVGRAADFLQRSVNALSRIKLDGIIGKETINACNNLCLDKTDNKRLKELLKSSRIGLYLHIVNSNETQRRFIKGWMNRTLEIFGD